MTMEMTAALNRVFADASERFEKANEVVSTLGLELNTLKQQIAYRKGVFEEMEASWIYGENLYEACRNEAERKSILALKKKGDPEYQVELVRQKDDERSAARLESQIELARGTMSLTKRRMDYATASRYLEAYASK
ncbi:MAG: hypothetical protein LC793_05955, partial [Thermomicrobia bacterium]|nr:hypothetical protein [Thermomicrobia bacterium]